MGVALPEKNLLFTLDFANGSFVGLALSDNLREILNGVSSIGDTGTMESLNLCLFENGDLNFGSKVEKESSIGGDGGDRVFACCNDSKYLDCFFFGESAGSGGEANELRSVNESSMMTLLKTWICPKVSIEANNPPQ